MGLPSRGYPVNHNHPNIPVRGSPSGLAIGNQDYQGREKPVFWEENLVSGLGAERTVLRDR